VKIQNAFRLGLFGGLGVLIAVLIGGAFASLATILTYIGAAIFIALGLDPLVTWLESREVAPMGRDPHRAGRRAQPLCGARVRDHPPS